MKSITAICKLPTANYKITPPAVRAGEIKEEVV